MMFAGVKKHMLKPSEAQANLAAKLKRVIKTSMKLDDSEIFSAGVPAGMQEIDPVEDPDSIAADPADTLDIEDVDTAAVAPPVIDSVNPIVAPPVVIPPPPPPPPPVPIDSIGNI